MCSITSIVNMKYFDYGKLPTLTPVVSDGISRLVVVANELEAVLYSLGTPH